MMAYILLFGGAFLVGMLIGFIFILLPVLIITSL